MNSNGDILVVRNDRLGDTMLALPVIPFLRNKFPSSKIHFLAAPPIVPLIKCVEGIDSVLSASDKHHDLLLEQIRSISVQTAFCLRPTFQNALALKRAKIPVRYGTSRRWYSYLFNHRIPMRRRGIERHEADLNLDLIAYPETYKSTCFPMISIPETDKLYIKELLRESGVEENSRKIILHPGSGNSARNWPVMYFRQLADLLSKEENSRVIITGTPSEIGLCNIVSSDRHLNLCGKSNLVQLAALILESNLLISNSTGPLHLAVALGIPVVGLYPPVQDCLPVRWGPYLHQEMAIVPDVPLCSKCHPGEISECYCMEQISPDFVLNKCINTIRDSLIL